MSSLSHSDYRPEIDGLRAFAVTSVMFYHFGVGVSAGFVGVDVFFVISGYLITLLLQREVFQLGQIDLCSFYARRFRRIAPVLIVVVLCTTAIALLLLPRASEKHEVASSASASLVFVANFFFQSKTGGYFDVFSERFPLLHLWSLGVEEQFYLIWPLLLIAMQRLPYCKKRLLLSLLGATSLVAAEIQIHFDPNIAFYHTPYRFWEFVLGGVVAISPPRQLRCSSAVAPVGGILLLLAIFIPIPRFPGVGALPAAIGAALVLFSFHATKGGIVGAVLSMFPIAYVGRLSYSLYLWHWPLLAIYRSYSGTWPDIVHAAALFSLALVLSFISYTFIELPTRQLNIAPIKFKASTAFVLGLTSLSMLIYQIGSFFPDSSQLGGLAAQTAADVPENRARCNYGNEESLAVFPKPRCNSEEGKPVDIMIWGDSHALSWQPLAWEIARREGVAATSLTRYGCPPVLDYDVRALNGRSQNESDLCREFNARVFEFVKRTAIKTLVVTALWPDGSGKENERFRAAFSETIERLTPYVGKIVILGQTPYLRDTVPRCIELGNLDRCSVKREVVEKTSGAMSRFLSTLSQHQSNVEFVDLLDFFCSEVTCPAFKDDYPLYSDSNHVSSTAARHFSIEYIERQQKLRYRKASDRD